MLQTAGFLHDANHTPLIKNGLVVSDSQKLTASAATANVPIFSITGGVQVLALWGVVTTALGNNTAAYWRLNDGTNQSNISLNTGTTLTNAPVGSVLLRRLAATNALTILSAGQERVQDPGGTGVSSFTEFILLQETAGVTTNVEFVYTTSDAPTTGAITFYLGYYALTPGAIVTPL